MSFDKLDLKPKLLSFDTETTGIVPYGDFNRWGFYPSRPFEFAFCDPSGNSISFRWKVDEKTRRVIPEPKSFKEINLILSDKTITKIGHNIGFDMRMSLFSGFNFKGNVHDTLIIAHIVTGGDELQYGLKELCRKYLDFPNDDEKKLQDSVKEKRRKMKKLGYKIAEGEMFGREPYKADYWLADPKLCTTYALKDAERTMLLFLGWYEKIQNDKEMLKVYEREMKLLRVVMKMEARGVRVFPEDLKSLRKFYEGYMTSQKKIADANGGAGMNYRSAKQKHKVFYLERKYEPIYFTKTGQASTNGDSLKYFIDKYNDKLARSILEYNGGAHMISGFLDPYERFKVKENDSAWVLHPNYRQCGPVTGRFSCGDPNLMQVASPTTGRKRTEITLRPREAFGPRDGYLWYLPDYSQIEVWVFSFLAQEEAMIRALLEGRDFHSAVSEQIWGEHPDFIKQKDYFRKRAKLLMFCKLYGGGVNKVAYLTDSTPQEASKFVDDFNTKLPGVQKFMDRMVTKALREGKITNPLGRSYYIQPNFAYKAVNYLVQGTSADILKNAMVSIDDLFSRKWNGCHLLLTLHDELVIEVPKKLHSLALMKDIVFEMQKDSAIVDCPIPLPVSMKIAEKRWSNTLEIDYIQDSWKGKYLCKKKY